MRRRVLAAMLLLPLALLLAGAETRRAGEGRSPAGAAGEAYATLSWDALLPPGWDPAAPLRGLDFSHLDDADPRAIAALERIRQAWDEAPLAPGLNGRKVRLPGFAIPLERQGDLTREYLLVPYFGACIHTPPPPANQMIHVIAREPVSGLQTLDAVWVSGTLGVGRVDMGLGMAGYRLVADLTRPYTR